MDTAITVALSHGDVVDITTTGRATGQPRRIEIVYHVIDGRIYISGQPRADRKRAWLSNLEANPHFTLHLKRGVAADLPATARPITDPAERRRIMEHVARAWKRTDVDVMVAHSPLIEVTVDGFSAAA